MDRRSPERSIFSTTLSSAVIAALAFTGVGSLVLRAQVVEQCQSCSARLELERSVGGSQLPLTNASRLGRDRSGRLFLTQVPEPGTISVLTKDGRVQRRIGRLGSGPGEFTNSAIRILPVAADSMVVLDGNRLSLLAPGATSVVSTRTIDVLPFYWFPISSDSIVAQAPIGGKGLVHVVDEKGRTARSIGPSVPFAGVADPYDRVLVIAPARAGGLWMSKVNSYRPVRISLAGDTLERLTPGAHWFSEWSGYDGSRPLRRPPLPHVDQLHEDPSGVLWVMSLVADRKWVPVTNSRAEIRSSDLDWAVVWDTVVEAWDIPHDRLLGRIRFDGQGLGFIGDRSLYVRRTDASGDLVFDVYLLSVAKRDQEER